MASQPAESTPAPAHGGPVPPIERAADAPPAVDNPEDQSVKDFADWEKEMDTPTPAEPKSGDSAPEPADDGEAGDPPDASKPEGASEQENNGEPDLAEQLRQASERERAAQERADAAEARLRERDKPGDPAPKQEDTAPDPAPDPEKYEFGEADAKFIADTARWHARQEYAAQRQRDALQSEIQAVETKWTDAIAKPEVVERYPDFAAKVTEGAKAAKWDCSPLMAIAIKDSDVGPDIAYHLASDPAESARIARLSNVEQAMEIGRLEGRYLAERKSASAPVEPKRVSEAPPPPQRSRGAGGKFAPSADTDDFSAFDKLADGILDGNKPY